MDSAKDITGLLEADRRGDAEASQRLAVLIYDELRQLARRRVSVGVDTLSATDLVHETYLKVFGNQEVRFPDRRHFYAYAARAMRSIVTDRARRRQAGRRGGDAVHVTLGEGIETGDPPPEQVIALDQMLGHLARLDARLAELVELRVFGGFEVDDLAALLGVSSATVKRDWQRARALLGAWLGGTAG